MIIVAIPIMILLLRIINSYYSKEDSSDYILMIMSSFSNVLLFCIFIIIYAFMINRKYPVIISIGILFIHLLLDTCLSHVGIPFSIASSNEATLLLSGVFNFLFVDIGYIILGFLLKKRSNL